MTSVKKLGQDDDLIHLESSPLILMVDRQFRWWSPFYHSRNLLRAGTLPSPTSTSRSHYYGPATLPQKTTANPE